MKEKKEALAGVDVGTGGCKISLVDVEGEMLASGFQDYPTYYPKPGWAEQNPMDWYRAIKKIFRKLLRGGRFQVTAICVDGQPHTPVFLNDRREILRPSIPWVDQRSREEVEWLKGKVKGEEQTTYNPLNTAFTLPQLVWVIQHEPEVWRRTHKILIAKDFIRGELSGGGWCTDPTDALGTYLFDGRRFRWSEELCEAAGIDVDKLPTVEPSARIVGNVGRRASEETGVPEGVPVLTGAHDPSMENLTAGTVNPRQGFIKLATAGVISVTTRDPVPDPRGRTVTYCLPTRHERPDGWFTKTATLSCGSSNRWFRDVFCRMEKARGERLGVKAYRLMDEEAAGAPLGSEGLIFHPYLMGEGSPYWDANLKGSFTGIALRHKKKHFCRAVLEGVVYSIYDSFRIFRELHLPLGEARIIGGGADSPLWRRIVCDVFGVRVAKPRFQDASYGSALLAGVGVGVFSSLGDAVATCVRIEVEEEPEEANHREYQRYFRVYRRIHDDLEEAYRKLGESVE